MPKRKFESIDNYEKIKLDIAASYIITLFGNYMESIVKWLQIDHLNVKIIKFNKKNEKLIDDLFDNEFTENKKLFNSLVGLGVSLNSDNAHWIYINKTGKIHNSYSNGLQINNSNQFCQSYALLMALKPYFRQNFSRIKKSYEYGYVSLLKFWKLHLEKIMQNITLDNHIEIIKLIKIANQIEDQNIVNKILKDYFSYSNLIATNILNILSSDYGIKNAPYFL